MALQRRVERDRTVSEGADLSLSVPSESTPVNSVAGSKTRETAPQVIDDSTSIDISITAETVAK